MRRRWHISRKGSRSPRRWRISGPKGTPSTPWGMSTRGRRPAHGQGLLPAGGRVRRLMRDRPGEGWSCYYLGRAHGEAEELGAAQEYQEQALSLAAETGDAELQARTKIALAALHVAWTAQKPLTGLCAMPGSRRAGEGSRSPPGGKHRTVAPGPSSPSPAQCRRGPQVLHRGGPTGRGRRKGYG